MGSDGRFDYRTPDGYEYYLSVGPVKNFAALMESNGPMKAGSTSTEGAGGGGANICAQSSGRVLLRFRLRRRFS